MQIPFEDWWKEVVKEYAKPFAAYGGMVYVCGSPPAGAIRTMETPTDEQVIHFMNNEETKEYYRSCYLQGKTPVEAFEESQ